MPTFAKRDGVVSGGVSLEVDGPAPGHDVSSASECLAFRAYTAPMRFERWSTLASLSPDNVEATW